MQIEFEDETFVLGEAIATIKEAVCDSFAGSIVVEYRTPEGTYLYAPDAMSPGEKPVFGELMTNQEMLDKYGYCYHTMDEEIGVLVDGEVQPLGAKYSIEQVKTADNVVIVNICFSMQGTDPENLMYSPGIFRNDSADWEQRKSLVEKKRLKLTQNTEKNNLCFGCDN